MRICDGESREMQFGSSRELFGIASGVSGIGVDRSDVSRCIIFVLYLRDV